MRGTEHWPDQCFAGEVGDNWERLWPWKSHWEANLEFSAHRATGLRTLDYIHSMLGSQWRVLINRKWDRLTFLSSHRQLISMNWRGGRNKTNGTSLPWSTKPKRVSLTRVVTGSRESGQVWEILSKWVSSDCQVFKGLTGEGVEVMKNDSTVSGLSNYHWEGATDGDGKSGELRINTWARFLNFW